MKVKFLLLIFVLNGGVSCCWDAEGDCSREMGPELE